MDDLSNHNQSLQGFVEVINQAFLHIDETWSGKLETALVYYRGAVMGLAGFDGQNARRATNLLLEAISKATATITWLVQRDPRYSTYENGAVLSDLLQQAQVEIDTVIDHRGGYAHGDDGDDDTWSGFSEDDEEPIPADTMASIISDLNRMGMQGLIGAEWARRIEGAEMSLVERDILFIVMGSLSLATACTSEEGVREKRLLANLLDQIEAAAERVEMTSLTGSMLTDAPVSSFSTLVGTVRNLGIGIRERANLKSEGQAYLYAAR